MKGAVVASAAKILILTDYSITNNKYILANLAIVVQHKDFTSAQLQLQLELFFRDWRLKLSMNIAPQIFFDPGRYSKYTLLIFCGTCP